MTRSVGLDVSQKVTAGCFVDNTGRRLWRGQCPARCGPVAAKEDARRTVFRHVFRGLATLPTLDASLRRRHW